MVEKALSVDNIFVFAVVFSYFAIPPKYQHRVLFYGILGALVLVFVGLKMVWLNDAFGGKFPISWSLGITAFILALSVIASLILPPRKAAVEENE